MVITQSSTGVLEQLLGPGLDAEMCRWRKHSLNSRASAEMRGRLRNKWVCCCINMLPSTCVRMHTHTHTHTYTHRVLQDPWRMTSLYRSMSFGGNSDHLGTQKRHMNQKAASLQKPLPGRQTARPMVLGAGLGQAQRTLCPTSPRRSRPARLSFPQWGGNMARWVNLY